MIDLANLGSYDPSSNTFCSLMLVEGGLSVHVALHCLFFHLPILQIRVAVFVCSPLVALGGTQLVASDARGFRMEAVATATGNPPFMAWRKLKWWWKLLH